MLLLAVAIASGLFGYWMRTLVLQLNSLKASLTKPPEPEHTEADFADPLTASQLDAIEQAKELERLNPGIKINR